MAVIDMHVRNGEFVRNWALEPDVGLVTKSPHHAQIMLAGNNFDAVPKDK
jgi:hypothetical protein